MFALGGVEETNELIDLVALREITDDDPRLTLDLLVMFLDVLKTARGQLAAAIEAGDREELARQAHELSGVAGTLGATRIHTMVRQVEGSCRDGDLAEAARIMGENFQLFAATERQVILLIGRLNHLDHRSIPEIPVRKGIAKTPVGTLSDHGPALGV